MVRVTPVPFGPRISFTASLIVRSLVDLSSIFQIMSPALMPARKAGVSSMGEMTVSLPSVMIDFDSEPAERAGDLDVHLLEEFRGEVGAVRVEGGEHAVYRPFGQFLVARRFPHISA